ncbi:MAG: pyruvoyl-dependent arginine decarboxylase [Halobacteriales archaeon]
MDRRRDVEVVRIVRGAGTGPTALASYDAALAAAGVHDYNVVTVSSILPAGATVELTDTAPDLGPPGDRLMAVEARATASGPDRVAAGLGWATGDGAGVVYEADDGEERAVREQLRTGIDAATDMRDRSFDEPEIRTATATADPGEYATAAVLAVFGGSEPI